MRYCAILILFSLLLISCQEVNKPVNPAPTPSTTLTLKIRHYFDADSLIFTTQTYINAAGNGMRFEKIKYFMSNIRLVKSNGDSTKINGYFLVDQGSTNFNGNLTLGSVPKNIYNEIRFDIGIDSIANHKDPASWAPGNVLNPLVHQDMFWDWANGYIFSKLEGSYKSNPSTSTWKSFVYHAGFDNFLRTISVPTSLDFRQSSRTLTLKADIAKWFNSPNFSILQPKAMFRILWPIRTVFLS